MLVDGSILNGQIAQEIRSPREVLQHVQPIGGVLVPGCRELLDKIFHLRRNARGFFLRIRQLLFQFASTVRTSTRQTPDQERRDGHCDPRSDQISDLIRTHPSSLHFCNRRHDGE